MNLIPVRRRPRVATLIATCAAATAFSALPAGAQAASFSGNCQLKGGLKTTPGVKFKSEEHTSTVTMTGPCTGGPGRLTFEVTGPISCTGSSRTNTGTGTLTVGDKQLPVKVGFDIKLPIGRIVLTGDEGTATGPANFVDAANGMQMTRCPGEGLKDANFNLNLQSSGITSGGEGGGGGGGSAKPSVGITVGKSQSSRSTRSRGFVNVRCKPTVAGTCKVTVRRGNTTLASGSARARAGQSVTVKVRLTRAGRRALRRSKSVRALVKATVPGASVTRTVTFKR